MRPLVLGTRDSALAIWQANYVKCALESAGLNVDLKVVKTRGDRLLDVPLFKVGGKGLFTKELEDELLGGGIDFAVHSLKDVPVDIPYGLTLASISERGDPRDCFLSMKYGGISLLPPNARVGTTSLRRSVQLKRIRRDLEVANLRGNVHTRLKRLQDGDYDAIVLANAAIGRLGVDATCVRVFGVDEMVPAVGQGALGIECRSDDDAVRELLSTLHDRASGACCSIERDFIRRLGGGCYSPIGVHCYFLDSEHLMFLYAIGDLDATSFLKGRVTMSLSSWSDSLDRIVEDLQRGGVAEILDRVKRELY